MPPCIILNPHAGTAADVAILEEAARQRLRGATIRLTQQPGDAKKFAREALDDGCELVIAAGGDGTINEVVNGLASDFSRAQLGIIPLGTGNDFARSINILPDLDAALSVLEAGRTRAIDVVCFMSRGERRYFINISAGGFSGLVDEELNDEMKRSWGPLAYLRAALEVFPDLTDYHTTICFDDEELQEIKVYNIVIANACYVAGGIPIAPQAHLDDGFVDVMIVPVAAMTQLALLVPQILLGQHLDNDLLTFRRARKVSIQSRPGMWFNVDGELMGNAPVTYEVLPQALRVISGGEAPSENFSR